MIFPRQPEETTSRAAEATGGCTLAFDYQTRQFRLVDGSPVRMTGLAAVQQWVELLVRTLPDRYPVYGTTGFGVSTDRIIGHKQVPRGYVASELWREIREGCAMNPNIQTVYGFRMEREQEKAVIYFTCKLYDGEEGVLRVQV